MISHVTKYHFLHDIYASALIPVRSPPTCLIPPRVLIQLRPYTVEYTGSRLISEVKLLLAQLVLGWGTTWEYCVL